MVIFKGLKAFVKGTQCLPTFLLCVCRFCLVFSTRCQLILNFIEDVKTLALRTCFLLMTCYFSLMALVLLSHILWTLLVNSPLGVACLQAFPRVLAIWAIVTLILLICLVLFLSLEVLSQSGFLVFHWSLHNFVSMTVCPSLPRSWTDSAHGLLCCSSLLEGPCWSNLLCVLCKHFGVTILGFLELFMPPFNHCSLDSCGEAISTKMVVLKFLVKVFVFLRRRGPWH